MRFSSNLLLSFYHSGRSFLKKIDVLERDACDEALNERTFSLPPSRLRRLLSEEVVYKSRVLVRNNVAEGDLKKKVFFSLAKRKNTLFFKNQKDLKIEKHSEMWFAMCEICLKSNQLNYLLA